MTTAVLRDATPDDAEVVVSMIRELAAHTGVQFVPLATPESIRTFGPGGAGHFRGVVAELDGRVVGMCLYSTMFSGWRGRPGLFVSDLFVDDSVRSLGLGKSLLAAVIERGRASGCSYVRLDVAADNLAAAKFYQRHGFIEHSDGKAMFLELGAPETAVA